MITLWNLTRTAADVQAAPHERQSSSCSGSSSCGVAAPPFVRQSVSVIHTVCCSPGFSIAYTTGSNTTEAESLATLARAQELGISMLDTANAYGFGANEQLLGELCTRPVVFRGSCSSCMLRRRCGTWHART